MNPETKSKTPKRIAINCPTTGIVLNTDKSFGANFNIGAISFPIILNGPTKMVSINVPTDLNIFPTNFMLLPIF